jgi:hypothetical protein
MPRRAGRSHQPPGANPHSADDGSLIGLDGKPSAYPTPTPGPPGEPAPPITKPGKPRTTLDPVSPILHGSGRMLGTGPDHAQ